jgi:hypothetical protein
MACCLLIASGHATEIQRRDATKSDLRDPNTIVLDQGGEHNGSHNNYDHHQFARDYAAECSITLILPLLGMESRQARRMWDWMQFTEVLDSKGPVAASQLLAPNIALESFLKTISPIETVILQWFSKHNILQDDTNVWNVMEHIGREQLDHAEKCAKREVFLHANALLYAVAGVVVCDVTCVPRCDNPMLALELFIKVACPDCGVIVSLDDRGNGYSLLRRDDHPCVDFSQLAKRDDIVFAHNNGFVAKTAPNAEPREMILLAIKE